MNRDLSPEALEKIERISTVGLKRGIIEGSSFSPEGEASLIRSLRNNDIFRAFSFEIGGRHFVC